MKFLWFGIRLLLPVLLVTAVILLNLKTEDVTTYNIFENFTTGTTSHQGIIPNNSKIVSGPWVGGEWQQQNEDFLIQFRDNQDQIPYITLYVVAGLASAKEGLSDCNTNPNPKKTLCVGGANFIRKNKEEILNQYTKVALAIKSNYGSYKPILLHFEPDFYQYQDHTQDGGRLTANELSEMMNSWTQIYKDTLPNAKLVMDVSSWNYDLKYWSDKFKNFDYGGMVGRRFEPLETGKDSNGNKTKTYKELIKLSGKPMIVNDSYGAGGKFLEYNSAWDNEELVKARFEDGVVAIIHPPNN
jgi:hypothetical protein